MQAEAAGDNGNRLAFVKAAQELFVKFGYQGTTVHQILEKTGLSSRDFYFCFESKEELLGSVVEQVIYDEIAYFERIASLPLDPVGKLSWMIRDLISFHTAKELLSGISKKRKTEAQARLRKRVLEQGAPVAEKVIDEGIARGVIHTVEKTETAKLLLNSILCVFDFSSSGGQAANQKMIAAFCHMTETSLGLSPGAILSGVARGE